MAGNKPGQPVTTPSTSGNVKPVSLAQIKSEFTKSFNPDAGKPLPPGVAAASAPMTVPSWVKNLWPLAEMVLAWLLTKYNVTPKT